MKTNRVFKVIKVAFFIALGVFLFGFVTMSLWNYLIPELFHGPMLNFGQAIGLLLLSKILFGGFKGGFGGCGGRWNGRQHWKMRFEEKLSKMTPEEREKFKQNISGKCRSWYGSGDWNCEAETKEE